MKIAVMEGIKKIVIRDIPEPVLEKDEVLIKIRYCGICGSDLHVYETGAILGIGHEYSGDIVKVGSKVKGWKIGDRVIPGPVSPGDSLCGGRCFWCSRGEISLCDQWYTESHEPRGAFVTYVTNGLIIKWSH